MDVIKIFISNLVCYNSKGIPLQLKFLVSFEYFKVYIYFA